MEVRKPVGPIQIQPPGLLGLLQLKVGGFMPDALAQDVQPTVDLEGYWLRAAAQNESVGYSRALVAATYGFTASLLDTATATVALGPSQQEWWFVHDYALRYNAPGGTGTNLRPAWTLRPGPGAAQAEFYVGETYQAAGAPFIAARAGGFWLPPGAVLGSYVDVVTAGLQIDLMGLRYTRCPV